MTLNMYWLTSSAISFCFFLGAAVLNDAQSTSAQNYRHVQIETQLTSSSLASPSSSLRWALRFLLP